MSNIVSLTVTFPAPSPVRVVEVREGTTWGTVTGKPLTFPPAEHTHAAPGWEDVTGKPIAFPPAEHAHAAPGWEDVTGKPLAFPPEEHTHAAPGWDEVTGKPLAFPPEEHTHTAPGWEDVTGKPLAFPPAEHTHAAPGWDDVTGKPLTFPPTEHTHAAPGWDDVTDKPLAFPPATHTHTELKTYGFTAANDGRYKCIGSGSGFTVSDPPSGTYNDTYEVLVAGSYAITVGGVAYVASSLPIVRRYNGSWETVPAPVLGDWIYKSSYSSFYAVKGGRYACDYGCTVSDPMSSNSTGDMYEVMVVGSGSSGVYIGSMYYYPSSIPVVRRYTGSYWETVSAPSSGWIYKSSYSSFYATKGGQYACDYGCTVNDPMSSNTTGDMYEVMVVGSGSSGVYIGGMYYYPSSIPVVRRYTGSYWETVSAPGSGWVYKSASFTAAKNGRYECYGNTLSVSDPPSGSTGDVYEVMVVGSASSAVVGGTTRYPSSLPVVRRYTGNYNNGTYWETVPSPVPATAFYDANSQSSTFYPSQSNGMNQKFYPSSSGSFTLGSPMGTFNEGDTMTLLIYANYGACSLSFMSIYIPSTFGNISTPVSLTSGKRYLLTLRYLNYSWQLTDIKGGY